MGAPDSCVHIAACPPSGSGLWPPPALCWDDPTPGGNEAAARRSAGANVIAAASTDDKLRACVAAGADQTLNYADLSYRGLRDAVRELAPGGVDVVFDPVGDVFTEPCVRNLAEGGRYLVPHCFIFSFGPLSDWDRLPLRPPRSS
eukprot:COSAG01_NODE_4480_length_4985_cov_15.664142_5_plen_145_part_00